MDEAFVYLWQDAREKPYKYYLGYHKGTPDDSYTHSSRVFESFSKNNIPNGVRRRILATGSTEEMMELENKLLNNRKDSKWDRYYNIITNFPPYMWDDIEFRKMQSDKLVKQWQDPEFRKIQSEVTSESTKKQWEDPEFRKMHSEKMSEMVKKKWQDPKYRKMQSEKTKKQWEDPKFRKKISEGVSESAKKRWQDPKFRNKMSERSKKQWEDPKYRKKMSELWEDPKYRKKISEKISEQNKKKVTCNVCGFVGNVGNIARWHNDNCKHKDTTTLENFLTD